MTDQTAEEVALEAMLGSRLESISARLHALTHASNNLSAETQELFTAIQAKFKRMYILEDNLLRIQGKPGLSNLDLETGPQPVPRRPAHMMTGGKGASIRDSDIEEIKMGVKTLRRKFQAAGAVVTTVGWWRHLKDKGSMAASGVPIEATTTPAEPPVPAVPVVPAVPSAPALATPPAVVVAVPVVPMIGFNAAAAAIKANKAAKNEAAKSLSVDTSLQTPMSPTHLGNSGVISPKTMLSPTSPSTKKRNTLTLQQIFTPPASATLTKPLQQRERANPALGLFSPPTSPMAPAQTPTAGNTLMRGLSLRS